MLGISRAVYYRKINHTPSRRTSEQALLDRRILRVYHESGRVYGAGKIRYLLAQNYSDYRKISIKRIQRSMKRQKIRSIVIKKFKAGKPAKKLLNNYQNLLKQDFSTTGLNQKWVADITYIHTLEDG
ncbi:IS3 family transposase [Enterococcus sp. HY326]|uniref:IS3 family transposase n=1 Tax=Enterococcus sp. HY326 TaxID=2971265 RepID=UPI002240B5CD|nr:IS3 family transposase [Enterococcus sp. HY326]